jgi:hypothetical protein
MFTEAENRAEYESWLLCSDSNVGSLCKPRVKKEAEKFCILSQNYQPHLSHSKTEVSFIYAIQRRYRQVSFMPGLLF